MTDNTEALPPIERDEHMDRTYIPLPGGWEVQTKGKGSTFRLCDTKSGDRWPVLDYTGLHEALERMAREVRAALAQRQQVPATAWLVEWRFNGVQWLYLWPRAPGGFSFTSDPNSALRFARREDAESALKWARDTDAERRPIGSLSRYGLALGEMLVTEHAWVSTAPALTAAPQAAEPVAATEFCWLVEEFAGGNSTGRYMLDQGELTVTANVHEARRFRRMRTAMFRAEDMREKHGGDWRHAHHGFTAPQAAQAQPQEPPRSAPLTEEERAMTAMERYNELLMAVGNKYPGETRHETALRYIRNAERSCASDAAAHGISTPEEQR